MSMRRFGAGIIINNAPAYEIQLAQSELPENISIRYNKVCAKDQTIVVGDAGGNKRYGAFCMVTSDPAFAFAGGIRAGAPVSTVENFFGKNISQLSAQPGRAHIKYGDSVDIDILYNNNTITQVGYYDHNSLSCQRIGSFFRRKAGEMNMAVMY